MIGTKSSEKIFWIVEDVLQCYSCNFFTSSSERPENMEMSSGDSLFDFNIRLADSIED